MNRTKIITIAIVPFLFYGCGDLASEKESTKKAENRYLCKANLSKCSEEQRSPAGTERENEGTAVSENFSCNWSKQSQDTWEYEDETVVCKFQRAFDPAWKDPCEDFELLCDAAPKSVALRATCTAKQNIPVNYELNFREFDRYRLAVNQAFLHEQFLTATKLNYFINIQLPVVDTLVSGSDFTIVGDNNEILNNCSDSEIFD
jgi:hypothetical protein